MNIVTGGGGFIGGHLVDRLGPSTVVVDPVPHPNAINMGCRIQDLDRFPLTGVDAIYHLASPVGPVGVLDWAGRLVEEVIETTAIVRTWAQLAGCPLIYVSTSELYGVHDGPTPESDPCVFQPETSARKEYAVAKLAAETMLRNTPGLDVRIIRPFNVAGPRQKTTGGFVLPRFIEQAKAGEPLTVYGDGSARRAFTHVLDIVDGIVRSATQGTPGEVYNLGNPENACTIAQLAADVIAITKSESVIEYVDPTTLWGPAFREAPDKVPDITKAQTELGWQPARDRATVIRDAC